MTLHKFLRIALAATTLLLTSRVGSASVEVLDGATARGGCTVNGFDRQIVRLRCGKQGARWTVPTSVFTVRYGEPKPEMKVGPVRTPASSRP